MPTSQDKRVQAARGHPLLSGSVGRTWGGISPAVGCARVAIRCHVSTDHRSHRPREGVIPAGSSNTIRALVIPIDGPRDARGGDSTSAGGRKVNEVVSDGGKASNEHRVGVAVT